MCPFVYRDPIRFEKSGDFFYRYLFFSLCLKKRFAKRQDLVWIDFQVESLCLSYGPSVCLSLANDPVCSPGFLSISIGTLHLSKHTHKNTNRSRGEQRGKKINRFPVTSLLLMTWFVSDLLSCFSILHPFFVHFLSSFVLFFLLCFFWGVAK